MKKKIIEKREELFNLDCDDWDNDENILNINDVLNVFSKAKNEGATHIEFDTTSGWDGDKGFCLISSLIIIEETDVEYGRRISLKNEADKNEAILKEKKERERMTKENAEKSKELLRKISLYEKELDRVMNTHSISVEPFQKSSVIVSKPLQIQIRVLLISEYELILEDLNKKLDEL